MSNQGVANVVHKRILNPDHHWSAAFCSALSELQQRTLV